MGMHETSCKMLRMYSHDKLWKGASRSYRTAAPLNLLHSYFVRNKIYVDSTVELKTPGNGEWLVFWIEKSDLNSPGVSFASYSIQQDGVAGDSFTEMPTNIRQGSLLRLADTWVALTDAVKRFGIDTYIVSETGQRMYLPHCYIHEVYRYYVVAINAISVKKMLLSPFKTRFYWFIDRTISKSDVVRTSLRVDDNTQRNSVIGSSATNTFTYINGFPTFPVTQDNVKLSDYVELVRYNDVVDILTVAPGTNTTSISGENVDIVHLPKNKNPNNLILVGDFVEPILMNARGIGRYLPKPVHERLFENSWIKQFTHNDFGLSEIYKDSLLSLFSTTPSSLTWRIVIRKRNFVGTLTRNVDYTDLLYLHDDATIVKFLTSDPTRPYNIPFWEAGSLLNSQYPEEFKDVTPNVASRTLTNYIDIYGFFNTMNIICPRVQQFHVTNDSPHMFAVRVPHMFNENFVIAHVMLDGLKLDDSKAQVVGPLLFSKIIEKIKIGDTHIPYPGFSNLQEWVTATDILKQGHLVVLKIDNSVDFTPIEGTSARSLVIELFEDTNTNTMLLGDEDIIATVVGDE